MTGVFPAILDGIMDFLDDRSGLIVVGIVILVVICGIIVAGLIIYKVNKNKVNKHIKYMEYKRTEQSEKLRNVDLIIQESKKWNKGVLINYQEYTAEKISALERSMKKPVGSGYASETKYQVFVDGNHKCFSFDMDSLYKLYKYFNEEIQRRHD
ncbi:MAG: hypothetical protein ACI4FO_04135 [Acutalibacteraceae bacterium]